MEYPQRPEWHVCHETNYHLLYQGRRRRLHRRLTARLRIGGSMRRRRQRTDQRSPRYEAPAMLVDQQPAVVEERVRIPEWEWEGYLIVAKKGRLAIGTLVDRTSRYVRWVHLPHGHAAQSLTVVLEALMNGLSQPARRTLTWDQGSEMSRHNRLIQ